VGVLWKLEPATAAKHQLYKRYLDAWWPILLQASSPDGRLAWSRVTYLDAFAGPGRYEGGEEGSPVFALRRLLSHDAAERMHMSRDRVRLLFMEKDPDRHRYLQAELGRQFGALDSLPVWAEAFPAEAGRDAEGVLQKAGAWGHPVLAVFDSWGNVNVPLHLVRRLARNRASEVIVTFGPNWFSRREELEPDQLDSVFGGHQYWQPADRELRPDERWRVWLATYRDALRRAGFRFQLHFRIVPKTGLPLYLVYGTGHPKGVEVMKDAMWDVDGNDGMGFADPRTRGATPPGQLALFSGAEDPELLELVRQRLEEGPVSVGGSRALAPDGDRTVAGERRPARGTEPDRRRGGIGEPGRAPDACERYHAALMLGWRGIWSQTRPSSSRPPAFGVRPPHCLKKNGTPAVTHASRIALTQAGSSGR
jgi:three-Cys-motif partner protein